MHDEEYQSKIVGLDKRLIDQEILLQQVNWGQDKINEKYKETKSKLETQRVILNQTKLEVSELEKTKLSEDKFEKEWKFMNICLEQV